MLKQATLSLAIAMAFAQNGFAAEHADYSTKSETVNTVDAGSLENALNYQSDIVVNDTAYQFENSKTDRFGTTYIYASTSNSNRLWVRQQNDTINATLFDNGVQKKTALIHT